MSELTVGVINPVVLNVLWNIVPNLMLNLVRTSH